MDIEDEVAALNFFQIHHLFMLREAFLGLGAVETPHGALKLLKHPRWRRRQPRDCLGTGVNAGVSILFHLIFWISHG